MRFSKFFFDRPSGQGFRKGLGLILEKPANTDPWEIPFETAFHIPDFDNQTEYIVSEGGRPFYSQVWFYILLVLCGLNYFNFLIVLWFLPGQGMVNQKGTVIQVKLSKFMLY